MDTITPTQARARIALSNILTCIRRRGAQRYKHIVEIIEQPSFHWLANTAGLYPHLTRLAFRGELERVRAGGFGIIGKGRVGGGGK